MAHESCKKIALKHLEVIAYRLQQLKDMRYDECPAVRGLEIAQLTDIEDKVGELRREVKRG